MAHFNRAGSWYTESGDENYGNASEAADPQSFPKRVSLTSTAPSQPYVMIPLPTHYELYTIQEATNLEDTEPCPAARRRIAQSLSLKNENLIENSLKSISLIRSRLLQQQEFNRKKTCEFQQMRNSIEVIRSLVRLVQDDTSKKTYVEFLTNDNKISLNSKSLKALKLEPKEASRTVTNLSSSSYLNDEIEPKSPIQGAGLERNQISQDSDNSTVSQSLTAMSFTADGHPITSPAASIGEIFSFYQEQVPDSVEKIFSTFQPQNSKNHLPPKLTLC